MTRESWPCWVLGLSGGEERAEEEAASCPCHILQSFQGPCYLAPASCPFQLFILSYLLCFLIPLCCSLPVAPVPPFTLGSPLPFPLTDPSLVCCHPASHQEALCHFPSTTNFTHPFPNQPDIGPNQRFHFLCHKHSFIQYGIFVIMKYR